jgi:hypothetical protein
MTNLKMSLGYDIFKKLEDGSPFWITQVATLAEAKEKLAALVRHAPVEYFIRDATTGKIVFNFPPTAE